MGRNSSEEKRGVGEQNSKAPNAYSLLLLKKNYHVQSCVFKIFRPCMYMWYNRKIGYSLFKIFDSKPDRVIYEEDKDI